MDDAEGAVTVICMRFRGGGGQPGGEKQAGRERRTNGVFRKGKEIDPGEGKKNRLGVGEGPGGPGGGGGGGKMDSVSEVQLGLKLVMARERKAAKEKGTEED